MKRLIAGLTVLAIAAIGVPLASAQTPGPLAVGQYLPKGLEGAFEAGSGQLAFLALAAPRNCIDGSKPGTSSTDCPFPLRVYFYDQSCTRVNSVPAPLTENGVALLAIHTLTSATAGNFLATTSASQTSPAIRVDDFQHLNPVIGTLFQVDLNRGIASSESLARVGYAGFRPYAPAAVAPFLPPDATGALLVALRFRCPVGLALVHPSHPGNAISNHGELFGTPGTLAGDMWEARSQLAGQTPGESYSRDNTDLGPWNLCAGCRNFNADNTENGGSISGFATELTFHVYDTNENLIGIINNVPCSCLSEFRWSALFPAAATQSTYVEIFGTAPINGNLSTGGVFTGSWRIQITVGGLNLHVSRRFHQTNAHAYLTELDP